MADEFPGADPTETAGASRPWWRRRPRLALHLHPVGLSIGLSLLLVAIGTSTAATLVYQSLDGNVSKNNFAIQRPDDAVQLKRQRFSDAPHRPLNILVMGDDSRDCSGCQIDQESGGGSDTTILIHLSRNRERAYGVSIPRDTMVDRPACVNPDGGPDLPAATYQQWNAAYSIGGPSCTIVQFETITRIPIDDSIVVNFQGFQDMVDAVGGVEVCIPTEIADHEHGIDLLPGKRVISGKEALSYVRVRHDVGDGSDLGRIKRQQAFAASMVKAVISARTLAQPFKVLAFLKAATKNIEFDDNITSLHDLAELGSAFKGISLDSIKFFTAPIATDPQNPTARVILAPSAAEVFKALRNDQKVPTALRGVTIKAGDVPGQGNVGKNGKKKKPHNSANAAANNAALQQAGLCAT